LTLRTSFLMYSRFLIFLSSVGFKGLSPWFSSISLNFCAFSEIWSCWPWLTYFFMILINIYKELLNRLYSLFFEPKPANRFRTLKLEKPQLGSKALWIFRSLFEFSFVGFEYCLFLPLQKSKLWGQTKSDVFGLALLLRSDKAHISFEHVLRCHILWISNQF